MSKASVLMIAAAGLLLTAIPSSAAPILLGTQVTGSINFGGPGPNYYNSSNGYVPAGCQNSGLGSPTVTIVDPTTEFCFLDGANRDNAQFTDTTITITDEMFGSGASNWIQVFTDAAFVGLTITELSDNFPNGGVNLAHVGNQLTFTWAGADGAGNFAAVYQTAAAVAEPAPLSLLGVVVAAARLRARRRKA